MKMLDHELAGVHRTEIEVKRVLDMVTIETAWTDDRETMTFSVFEPVQAVKLAWAIIKAALVARLFRGF